MNNLGGYKRIELIFADELSIAIPMTANKIYLRKYVENEERILPITDGSTLDSSSKKSDEGKIYTHDASILLVRVTERLLNILSQLHFRGCVLVATTNNNEIKVFGTKATPLFGTIDEVPGSKPSDLRHFKLSLSTTLTHPALTPF
ncbi:MAG: hypothetical protein ACRCUJ_07985 [Phocaeicola sp.]